MRNFTGNPFVDAGIAAMCAAAGVDSPHHLNRQSILQAVQTLYSVLLSDSAFMDKPPLKRFATSTMSMIFPNSPLPQGSYPTANQKREKYRERIDQLLRLLDEQPSDAREVPCFVCGQPAPLLVGIDQFPLMSSKAQLNFHPMLTPGHCVCAFCALAVQFLPLSLMQTKAEGGRLWFLHTADASLSIAIAKEYGVRHLSALAAAGEPLQFAGNWACPGESGAIVSLLYEIGKRHAVLLEQTPYAMSAFLFSNDNREQFVKRIGIPNRVIGFFNALQVYPTARDQFEKEILRASVGIRVCEQILHSGAVLPLCISTEDEQLMGGWQFHRLYSMEVLGMSSQYIQVVEEVAKRLVADAEGGRKVIKALQLATARTVFGVLLDMVRDGWMSRHDLHVLCPPGEAQYASQARDYLLGAAYALLRGERLDDVAAEEPAAPKHPLIARIEQIGSRVLQSPDSAKKLLNHLRLAQRPQDVRRAYLPLVATGVLSWADFIFFCPPEDIERHYHSRDYWLAFLYDQLSSAVDTEEELPEQ